MENILELYEKAVSGKSCLLFLEHYSNFVLPLFSYLARTESEKGGEIDKAVITISGIKLNEENPIVAAFTGAYSRIVIYPSRSLQGLDAEKNRAEARGIEDKKTGRRGCRYAASGRHAPQSRTGTAGAP
ncbi:MAG: hypothetical protein LBP80_06610 [Treponema sp.]|nr:hypothetical protein [Treponema sp.]